MRDSAGEAGGAGGEVVESRSAALGVSHVTDARFDEALWQLLGDWRYERAPRIASGMIGSRQGWKEAPYLPCPAGPADIAGALVDIAFDWAKVKLVPGLSGVDESGVAEVMRGELEY